MRREPLQQLKPIAVILMSASLGLSGCSVSNQGGPHGIRTSEPANIQALGKLYASVYSIEDGFRASYLTMEYPEEGPTYLSNIRELYARLDSELVAVPQFSDSKEFSRLRNELIQKYGATSYFIAFGKPISDRYGSVLYISGYSAGFKEFVKENPRWRDIKLSSLLKYRLKRAGYGG